jgi:TonB family protein
MSTTFLSTRQTSLPNPNRFTPPAPASQKDAWKEKVGNKQVPARLSLLPTGKPRTGVMGVSLIAQITVAAFLVSIPMLFPQRLIPKMMYSVIPIATPPTEVPLPPKPPVVRQRVQPTPPIEQPVEEPKVSKLFAPRIEAPKPKPKNTVAPTPVNASFAPAVNPIAAPDDRPARPREPVKTGNLGSGSAAVPTLHNVPPDKVQTGGFGDPNGVPSHGQPTTRGVNINQFGSPDLPPGPGYGNGTGGAHGQRGTVASTGFGNGTANPPPARGGHHNVQSGGFSNQDTPQGDTPKPKQTEAAASVQPVVILVKPNPVYTDEARKLGLEGEVVLDVIFPASGPVHVNRVISGLGHGLDENAIKAAEHIQFKPAISDGHPVDFPAKVHIVFQIAE